MRHNHQQPKNNRVLKRDAVYIDHQKIGYYLYEHSPGDHLSPASNASANVINVYIPGHGQRATTAKQLLTSITQVNPYQRTWSIDIDPAPGGSLNKARALVKIIEQMISKRYPSETKDSIKIRLIGWSQGGSEAMLAAALAPHLIPSIACLCSTGLVYRSVTNLISKFAIECTRILTDATIHRNVSFSGAVRFGGDIMIGVVNDVLSTRSVTCAWEDLRDATRQICGANYDYCGDVLLVFAENDTVIRWRDAFPGCKCPEDVQIMLPDYKQKYFPQVRNLKVEILPGNHLAPEADAERYIQTALMGIDPIARPLSAE